MKKKPRTIGSVLLMIAMWYFIIAGIVAIIAFTGANFFFCAGYLSTCGHPGLNVLIALVVGLSWPVLLPLYLWGAL